MRVFLADFSTPTMLSGPKNAAAAKRSKDRDQGSSFIVHCSLLIVHCSLFSPLDNGRKATDDDVDV
jgi:hypothetical protein